MEQVQEVPTLEKLLRQIVEGNETAFEVAQELLGPNGKDGKKITLAVQRRKLNAEPPPEPVKAPSPRRMHTFFDGPGFAKYLGEFGNEKNTVILADPAGQKIYAVLNERGERGFEVVMFAPLVHPLFAPWAAVLAEPGDDADGGEPVGAPSSGEMPLKKFIRFLSENRRQVVDPPGRDLARMLQQVRMSRKVELQQGFGHTAINGVMIETTIAGQAKTETVDLPEVIAIKCPLYVATSDRRMEIDLSLSADEMAGVSVRLSSGDVPVVRVEVFQEMLEAIKKDLGGKMTVALGRPSHSAWECLHATRA